MAVVIKPFSKELLPQFLDFFDNIAFADNPDWSNCYCCYYQTDCSNEQWGKTTKEANRLTAEKNILAGKVSGYLAFENEKPVAWCNVNMKNSLPRLSVVNKIASLKADGKIASVVCFMISPAHRGKGIATSLLKQVIKDFAEKEYNYLEAYPRVGENLSAADQFHGPLKMFLAEGFYVEKEFEGFAVVRKKLQPASTPQ